MDSLYAVTLTRHGASHEPIAWFVYSDQAESWASYNYYREYVITKVDGLSTQPASGDGKGEFRQRSDDCREWEQTTPAAEAPVVTEPMMIAAVEAFDKHMRSIPSWQIADNQDYNDAIRAALKAALGGLRG